MERNKIIALGDSIIKGVILNIEESGKMHYALSDHNIVDQVAAGLHLEVVNLGKMGCTIESGENILDRHLSNIHDAKYALLCYGGNDSDYNWRSIALSPRCEHYPKTPIAQFEKTYRRIIDKVRQAGLIPVVMSLPPMDAEKYYRFFTSMFSNEEKRNVSRWLKGGSDAIYAGHELYNDAVKRIASTADVQMIDVSNAFHDTEKYLCVDGIHPNNAGQEKIAKTIAKAIL